MSFLLPPSIPDILRGDHSIEKESHNKHPLEKKLVQMIQNEPIIQFKQTAALFGIGFAKELDAQREIIVSSQTTHTSFTRPSGLALQVFTGQIDDIDFQDTFAPDGMRSNYEVDCHEIQELRIFKKTIF